MRLWTIHPRYLDSQGPVALWREALLAWQYCVDELGAIASIRSSHAFADIGSPDTR